MARAVRVTIEGSDELLRKLKRLGISTGQVVEAATTAGASIVRDGARPRAPGPHVEQETVKRTESRAEVDVGPDKEHWYYRFFEMGAGPHAITGNPYLAFPGGEGGVVTRSVRHPGMAARPFLRPAMDENKQPASQEMGTVWRRAIESI